MIVQYHESGEIFNVIFDPVHPGVAVKLTEMGERFLDLQTIPWPETPVLNIETGDPLLDEEGNVVVASQGYDSIEVDAKRDYVFDGSITLRPNFDAPDLIEIDADGVDERVLENLPENAHIIIDNEVHNLEGTTLTIVSDMPAEYVMRVQKFPYIERTIKVIANAT